MLNLHLSAIIYQMTITQTIEIPFNRRIFLDLPPELPVGKAKVELNIVPETRPEAESGIRCKSDLLLPPTLDTNDWKFSREEANER